MVCSAPARAALAGNPSDGYGGAVLAVCLDSLQAEVDAGLAGRAALLDAAVDRFAREFGYTAPEQLGFATSIPQSVGLGGSSAIVIATLRWLCERSGVELDPVRLARLALSIEVDDLGIAAGLQDRLVQSYGALLFMDFRSAEPVCEPLDPARLPPLLIAWREAHGEASGVVHGDLRARFDAGDGVVRAGMERLGSLAWEARAALVAGEPGRFRAAVDGTFEIRHSLMPLRPQHVEMVEVARGAGAAVNYTGSGGAVVCACDSAAHREGVWTALSALGCGFAAVGQ